MVGIVVVLVLGVIVSALVGAYLQRTGRPFLDDVLRDDRVSREVATLLAVMFALLALGTVAVVAVVPMPAMSLLSAVVVKLVAILLVLGATHLLVVGVLRWVERRRRHQMLEEEVEAQLRSVRRHHLLRRRRDAI